MKKVNGTTFLFFFIIALIMLGIAVGWIAVNMSKELALGMGIGGFMVIVLFSQQILTGIQLNENTQNLVDYDKQQAGIEEGRMKTQVIYAQAMRDTAKVQSRIDERQFQMMQVAAQKMAGYLSQAEVAKIKAEMEGMGLLPDNSQNIELD
jgi:hypothetical protein